MIHVLRRVLDIENDWFRTGKTNDKSREEGEQDEIHQKKNDLKEKLRCLFAINNSFLDKCDSFVCCTIRFEWTENANDKDIERKSRRWFPLSVRFCVKLSDTFIHFY